MNFNNSVTLTEVAATFCRLDCASESRRRLSAVDVKSEGCREKTRCLKTSSRLIDASTLHCLHSASTVQQQHTHT